jgi:hypothetical protein
METHHTQHANAVVPVDDPTSELRNHAVQPNHLHGEGWEKKKEREKNYIFVHISLIFEPQNMC